MWTGFWGCARGGAHRNNPCLHVRWWSGSLDHVIPLSPEQREKNYQKEVLIWSRMVLLWSYGLSLTWSPSQALSVLSFFFLVPPFHSILPLWCRPWMPPRVLLQKLPFSPDVSAFWKKRLHWIISWLLVYYSAISLSFVLLDWGRKEERQSNGGKGLDYLSLQAQESSVEMGGALGQRSQDQI